jgi:ubiquinone/menaquinone biosynthesis C-methylase UbiE
LIQINAPPQALARITREPGYPGNSREQIERSGASNQRTAGTRMSTWMMNGVSTLLVLLAAIGVFFFLATRGALMLRGLSADSADENAHVYPLYSNMRLIRLVDFQPIISAILLFQYHRLVSRITSRLRQLDLDGRKVLVTSCAFGNVIPRVVKAAVEGGAERVLVADIIRNELIRAESKLGEFPGKVEFVQDNATAMKQADGRFAANVIFFLLHELPHPMKLKALSEAGRMLAPGGQLLLAEFHRPESWVLRAMSWTYFKVFEPYGLALWDTHDPLNCLEEMGGWTCERTTCFFGNFQIIIATRQ